MITLKPTYEQEKARFLLKPTYEQEKARFLLKLHLASRGRNSARETGSSDTSSLEPKKATPVTRITDRRHLFWRDLEDHRLKQYFDTQQAEPASLLPLVLACLAVWSMVAAAVWWLCQNW